MSWSFHAIGKPAAVIKKAEVGMEQCAKGCAPPEQTLIRSALYLVITSLQVMPSDQPVKVTGSGSQHLITPPVAAVAAIPAVAAVAADFLAVPPIDAVAAVEGKPAVEAVAAVASNTFNLSIEPIYGFVE